MNILKQIWQDLRMRKAPQNLRPARCRLGMESLEARDVPAAMVFDSLTGLLTINMAEIKQWSTGHYLRMDAAKAGNPSSTADDYVVLDDGAGLRDLAIDSRTNSPREIRLDQLKGIQIIGSNVRDEVHMDRVTRARGFALASVLVQGNGGDDTLNGSDFADVIFGGDGRDTIRGHGGNDLLDGGNGSDVLKGGNGRDHMIGGAGDDQFYCSSDMPDRIDGGLGNDIVYDWRNIGHILISIEKTRK